MSTYVQDTATLRDALDAASFFASSMGRVGADFQSMLAPIFEPRLTEMIVGHWTDGLNGMIETLKACRDAGVASPLFGTETSSGKDGNGHEDDSGEMQSSRTPVPPRKLLALPPLARFVNAYLNGLNELRRCLLPGSFPSIRSAHLKLVSDAKMALQANERAVLTPGLRGEASRLREVASKMKSEFDHCVEPYMTGCLEVAFGSIDYALVEAEKSRAVEEAKLAAEREKRAALERTKKAEADAKAESKREAAKKANSEEQLKEDALKEETAAVQGEVDGAEQERVATSEQSDFFDGKES